MRVILSLGSNLSDRYFYITQMQKNLKIILDEIISCSLLMETVPLEVSDNQEPYLNRLILGDFLGTPQELLNICQKIERKLGRKNKGLKKSRTADIDIIWIDTGIVNEADLKIPHISINKRRFLLEGLSEIGAELIDQYSNKKFKVLYENMSLEVRKQKIEFLGSNSLC